jgi:hypothetical protein
MISRGLLGKALDGGTLRGPPAPGELYGKVTNRYSLALCTWQNTGRTNAKANDTYRSRYGELLLAHPNMADWPEEARIYPLDDAENSLENSELQIANFNNLGPIEFFNPNNPHAGLTHMALNAGAAFAARLITAWGPLVDAAEVERLSARVDGEHAAAIERFKGLGLFKVVREKGAEVVKEDGLEIKRRVIRAYSKEATGPCVACKGTGKLPSAKTGNPINCATCGGTKLEIPASVPKLPTGNVSASEDTLMESGDEVLTAYCDATEGEKIRTTYVPNLRRGTRYGINSESRLLDTARFSFQLSQTLPKTGGVRECVIPRPGNLLCSVDYNALEFCTLGQVSYKVAGYSAIRDAINTGADVHSMLGANIVAKAYEEFLAAVKAADKYHVAIRQAAKAGNFGFGGLMGHARFVLTQRKERIGGHGSICRLMGYEEHPCGSVRLDEWNGRECKPICDQCLIATRDLKNGWLKQWPEINEYFAWVTSIPGIEDGQGIMKSPGTGFIRGGLNASEGANHPFQHLAGYGAKLALYNVSRECYAQKSSALYGSRIVVFAHDELILEVPEQYAHDAGERLAKVMIDSMQRFVPDVKITAEPALMRRWYKAAKTVRDANGKLICWEPEVKKVA